MLGFAVAVDDAGAGYGSLQCLAEVKPEWLKIDMSLTRGVEKDEVRQQLITSLVTFAVPPIAVYEIAVVATE